MRPKIHCELRSSIAKPFLYHKFFNIINFLAIRILYAIELFKIIWSTIRIECRMTGSTIHVQRPYSFSRYTFHWFNVSLLHVKCENCAQMGKQCNKERYRYWILDIQSKLDTNSKKCILLLCLTMKPFIAFVLISAINNKWMWIYL